MEKERQLFPSKPSEVLEGMLKLLALAGASNGLETSLYIQKCMISTEGKGV